MLPRFIKTPAGDLFAVVYSPEHSPVAAHWVLHVPAFAEEMNKSRKMVSMQADALACEGLVVVVPDLHGTGDSPGEFGAVSWQRWKDNLIALIDWIHQQGAAQVTLWGLRLGCLLAADVLADLSEPKKVGQLVLWQPVPSGQVHLNQFLRLRVAASMMGGGEAETIKGLRELMVAGHTVEVGGYDVTPALAASLDELEMHTLHIPPGIETTVLEVNTHGREHTPAIGKVIALWRSAGVAVASEVVKGSAFWATQEIAVCAELVNSTRGAVTKDMTPAVARGGVAKGKHGLALPFKAEAGRCGNETPLVFSCGEDRLCGVLHAADNGQKRAVLIVVGGPQYRVGSHRQFVHMARCFALQGFPVMRFDYRGMGDSEGESRGFEHIDEDIRCAIDALCGIAPEVTEVVVLGLCDAATAASYYAPADARVAGLILLNPWVHSERGQARAYLRHYYIHRVLSTAFWRKVLSGGIRWQESFRSFWNILGKYGQTTNSGAGTTAEVAQIKGQPAKVEPAVLGKDLGETMYRCLAAYHGPVLCILSGNDLTAAEFRDAVDGSRQWRNLIRAERFTRSEIKEADHTFSKSAWQDDLTRQCLDWLRRW